MKPRSLLVLAALLLLLASLSTAQASMIKVGFNGGSTFDPVLMPSEVMKTWQELGNGTGVVTVDIYLSLDPLTDPAEVASIFEGQINYTKFDVVVELDNSNADWDSCFDNLTPERALFSCTSNNKGGERLIDQFVLDPGDPFGLSRILGTLNVGALVGKDIPNGIMEVPLSTPAGTVLFGIIPEPGTASLLALGLAGLATAGRRRGH